MEGTDKQTTAPESPPKKPRRWRKRLLIGFCCFVVFVVGVLGVLQLGAVYTDKTWKHWSPDYEKTDITALLEKETLSDEDYDTLYYQTGLTRLAVDDMRGTLSGRRKILDIQEAFFKDYTVYDNKFTIFTYMEEVEEYVPLAHLRDGDIIVTATTRVSWWRYGHAALVVDGDRKLLVESFSPGTESTYSYAEDYFSYLADFIVLRPRIDAEVKAQVVEYAQEELVDLPYRFTVGIFSKKYTEGKLKGTQCAHLVWHAYKRFGYDLDSNGGGIVKPRDIARSEYVEVVQTFGFDPDKLWN